MSMDKEQLTIVIPALNEENTIAAVIEDAVHYAKKIIVVDNASTDKTAEIARSYNHVELLSLPIKGKGRAMIHGLLSVATPYVAFQDADREYPLENMVKLYSPNDEYDMVVGVRGGEGMTSIYQEVSLGSFVANKIMVSLTGVPDVFSGQRILRTDFMRSLKLSSTGFEIETEITAKSLCRKANIKYVRVAYHPRNHAEGKKIRGLDFFRILFMYSRVNLNHALGAAL